MPAGAHEGAKLLVVDDEPNIRSSLLRALSLAGYLVSAAQTGREALGLLTQARFDLMILDLRLPDVNGLEVMKQAHQQQPDLIVVVLTGYATLENVIAALRLKVVDYLLKPVSLAEIVATVSSALKERQSRPDYLLDQQRPGHQRPPDSNAPNNDLSGMYPRIIEACPLTLDRLKQLITVNSEPAVTLDLTRGETAIMAGLMSHPEHVLSCVDLVRLSWGYQMPAAEAQRVVRPYISRLRSKLESIIVKPRLIRTVRRRGYHFVPAPVFELTSKECSSGTR